MNELIEIYKTVVLKKYAEFNGRARRREYWMFVLANFIVSVVLGIIANLIHASFLSVIYLLAIIVPGIALSIRRMHDINKSGWWILVGLIPLIGWIWLIILAVQEGTKGPNTYGPDPKQP